MKKAEFKSFLKSVPKAELHLHLEAVISLAGVKKLYKNKFAKEMPEDEQKSLFSYNDLALIGLDDNPFPLQLL